MYFRFSNFSSFQTQHGRTTRRTQTTHSMPTIMTKSRMAKREMAPTVAHRQRQCTMAWASKPHYRCPTRPINRNTMTLVVMVTDMVTKRGEFRIQNSELRHDSISLPVNIKRGRKLIKRKVISSKIHWISLFLCFQYPPSRQHHNKNGHDRHHYNQHHAAVAASYADRSYSLPRTAIQPQNPNQMAAAGYYTQDRRAAKNNVNGSSQNQASRSNGEERTERTHHRHHPQAMERTTNGGGGADTPDFYFMPSQRKYSGEVVRVYVDYNKDPK